MYFFYLYNEVALACSPPSALPILLLKTINLNEPKELFKFHLAWGTPGTWHQAPELGTRVNGG